MTATALPEPSREPVSCNSWVISDASGKALWETYRRDQAQAALDEGLTVETAYAYLTRINK